MENDIGDIVKYVSGAPGFTLGAWHVHPDSGRLVRDGVELKLTPRTMNVLNHLALRAGALATYEELLAEYWRGAISSPNALHKCVTELRRVLATGGDPTVYVETVPKRGYRLVPPVRRSLSNDAPTLHDAQHRTAGRTAHLVTAGSRSALLAPVVLPTRHPTEAAFLEAIERAVIARAGQQSNVSVQSITLPADATDGTAAAAWAEADYAVHVDAQAAGDQLRASLVVTPVAPGLPSHQQHFESTTADRLGLVDEVMSAGVAVLGVLLDDRHLEGMREWGTRNVHAYRLLTEAEPHLRSLYADAIRQTVNLLERAIEHDPECAQAYAVLSGRLDSLAMISRGNAARDQVRQHHHDLLLRAQRWLKSADVIAAIGQRYRYLSASSAFDAEALWNGEIRENPLKGQAFRQYANLLVGARLIDESEAYMGRAIELARADERDWFELDELAQPAARGQFERLLALMKRNLERFPDLTITNYGLVRLLAHQKRFTEAELYLSRLEARDVAWGYFARLTLMAMRGDIPPRSNALAHAFAHPHANNTNRGAICFMLGDIESGVHYWREIDPEFLPLLWQFNTQQELFWAPGVRDDPQYQELLDELGIGPRWRAYMRRSVVELAPVTGIPLTTPA